MADHYTPLNGNGQLRPVPHHVVKVFHPDTDAGQAQAHRLADILAELPNKLGRNTDHLDDANAVLDALRGEQP